MTVTRNSIWEQLKALNFGHNMWNRAEINELPHIIHEGEKISECVNGYYEGGTALLVATELRLLLIDKKPLNYLNVEDLRFDMINEIDYSHRMSGATITVSTGSKTLRFKSFNQARLRHLINLVQEHMSSAKRSQAVTADTQAEHLEEINKQLRMYLMAQHQQLQKLSAHMNGVELPRPEPALSDYLLAQQLLERFEGQPGGAPEPTPRIVEAPEVQVPDEKHLVTNAEQEQMLRSAKREVFNRSLKSLGKLSVSSAT